MIETVRRLAHDLPPSPRRIDLEAVLGPCARPALTQLRVERRPAPAAVDPVRAGPRRPGLPAPAGGRGPWRRRRPRRPRQGGAWPRTRSSGSHSRKGWAVCGVDPRGIGESATTKMGWVFAVSLLLGENFVGRQSSDLCCVIDALTIVDAFVGKPISLYARGPNASLMATYAIACNARRDPGQSPLKWYLLRDGFLNYRAFFERPESLRDSFRLMPADGNRTTSFDREIPAWFVAFDVLYSWDLPQLLASSRSEGLIVNPINGDWNRLSEPEVQKLLPRRIRVVSGPEPDRAMKRFLQSVLAEKRDSQ